MIFGNKKLILKNQSLESEVNNANGEIARLNELLELEKQKVKQLEEQNLALTSQGDRYLEDAKQQAGALMEEARKKYEIEINRLRNFVNKWLNALPEAKELTPESRKRRALAVALSEILKNNPCIDDIEQGVELLQKLASAMDGKGEQSSEFNLDEVLNPGSDLDLATLCKELGVMD